MCAEMGTRRLICLGQSWGGYAAIRYGAELDADAVIAFSPEILRVMGGAGLERIRAAVGGEVDPADLDLRLLLSRRHRTPRTWIVYGAGNAADTRSAEYLAGLPGVVQRAVPGINHHAIMAPLVISGRFSRIFERISAEVGPGRWRADSTHQ
jgi:pimeloyl-ACP methyl ester carboxylesterase